MNLRTVVELIVRAGQDDGAADPAGQGQGGLFLMCVGFAYVKDGQVQDRARPPRFRVVNESLLYEFDDSASVVAQGSQTMPARA